MLAARSLKGKQTIANNGIINLSLGDTQRAPQLGCRQ